LRHSIVGRALGQARSPDHVRWAAYWCGLHSHHADTEAWKGFVQVPLGDVAGDLWGVAMAERAEALGLG
jgi:hypothetical protein